ncbi:MAG: signal peptide peptidase SppA [Rickettsiaceae bacterium]
MNINPDYLIERKRNKKQLTKWKILSFLLVIGLLYNFKHNMRFDGSNLTQSATKEYIASIKIQEVIFDDLDRIKRLQNIKDNDNIKALIVNINSPGGSVVGSEMLYNSLRKIAKVKPVVVVMGSLAASGGYLTALGGDYIVAHNGTLTGSIGVIIQSAEVTELAEKLGIKFDNFKSDPLKAVPNPTEKVTPEIRQATMETINDVYDYFIEQVALRRNLNIDYVRQIADGRVYSGHQALKLKLIDELGDEDTALDWLHNYKNISPTLKVVGVKLKSKDKIWDILLKDIQGNLSNFVYSNFAGIKSLM